MYNLENLVMGLYKKVPLSDGTFSIPVNLDNAATTPPFIYVMSKILDYAPWYSSIHRGTGYKSLISSDIYEESRFIIKDFVKADLEEDDVIFTKNTTESINILSYMLYNENKDIVIISTSMEHHSNDLPWRKFKIDYIDINEFGELDLDDLENKLIKYKGKVKLVTVTGASNVTGIINPIHKIAEIAHKYNSKILVDGAQLVPHIRFDKKSLSSSEHIDFLVFSAHKMYAPFGIGVIIGYKKFFEKMKPVFMGGGTIKVVTHDLVTWDESPAKHEAGSPNIIGVVALTSAMKKINDIGFGNIEKYEDFLTSYTIKKLENIEDIILYTKEEDKKVSIIPFNIKGIYHEKVAKILSDNFAISIRSGCFCAHPYVIKLLKLSKEEIKNYIDNPSISKPGMLRISFGLYNTIYEIDRFIYAIKKIISDNVNI